MDGLNKGGWRVGPPAELITQIMGPICDLRVQLDCLESNKYRHYSHNHHHGDIYIVGGYVLALRLHKHRQTNAHSYRYNGPLRGDQPGLGCLISLYLLRKLHTVCFPHFGFIAIHNLVFKATCKYMEKVL